MEDLTARQQQILEFIASAVDQRGIAPTFREMGDALGIRSTNGVADHVKALERKGYIERPGGRGSARSIRLTDRAVGSFHEESTVAVPLLGRVAAGIPALAVENYDSSIRVDSSMLPNGVPCFALTVSGESMIEDGILDGDMVVVRQTKTARDGDTVVARVGDEATVKRFYKEKGRIRLQPANSTMEPIYVGPDEDIEVMGKVIALIRQF